MNEIKENNFMERKYCFSVGGEKCFHFDDCG
jgi:hypothetical protein